MFGWDEATKEPGKIGVRECDALLEDLEACAKKHPDVQDAHDSFRKVFLNVAKDDKRRDELRKTCAAQRQLVKNDFRRYEDCEL